MKSAVFPTVISLVGTYLSYWLGGWDIALKVLVTLMVVDILTGIGAGIAQKNVDSHTMFVGGLRKFSVLLVVTVCVALDHYMNNSEPVFRTLSLYFYSAREGLSVTENLGIMGVPLPPFLDGILTQLQNKGTNQKP